jgi:MFS family permease
MHPPSSRPRTSLQLILDRDFGRLFWGGLARTGGYWAQTLLVASLVYSTTGSAAWVGLVGTAQLAPQLALALPMGKLADRSGPLAQIVLGSVICAVSSLGLGLWIAADQEATSVAVLLTSAFLYGVGFAICSPAVQSMAPRLVGDAELPRAVALIFAIPMSLGRAAGPVGGAALATAASPDMALGVVACAHLAFAACAAGIKVPSLDQPALTGHDMRIGSALRSVQRERRLLILLLGVAVVGFGAEPAITLAPAMADELGEGVGGAGRIASAFGLGSLLGVIVQRPLEARVHAATLSRSAMLVLGCSLALAGASPTMAFATTAMGLAGASMLLAVTGFSVAIQQICAPEMLGRVMALWLIAFLGVRPLAGVAEGFVADRLSASAALFMTAFVVSAFALLMIWIRRVDSLGSGSRAAPRKSEDLLPAGGAVHGPAHTKQAGFR